MDYQIKLNTGSRFILPASSTHQALTFANSIISDCFYVIQCGPAKERAINNDDNKPHAPCQIGKVALAFECNINHPVYARQGNKIYMTDSHLFAIDKTKLEDHERNRYDHDPRKWIDELSNLKPERLGEVML